MYGAGRDALGLGFQTLVRSRLIAALALVGDFLWEGLQARRFSLRSQRLGQERRG
ncbi:hypothetical protein bcgnr5380_60800 [Bacillus cereus]